MYIYIHIYIYTIHNQCIFEIGLWRYEENVKEGASVYQSIIINTSKEMMCYSDFPIPREYANYLHNSKVIQYMRLYAKQLSRSLKFLRENDLCDYLV